MEWLREMKDPQEFLETLKIDLFEDEVFVFTPKGDVKWLPAGSTPVDFAFEVHTDIGLHCSRCEGERPPRSPRLPAFKRRIRRNLDIEECFAQPRLALVCQNVKSA